MQQGLNNNTMCRQYVQLVVSEVFCVDICHLFGLHQGLTFNNNNQESQFISSQIIAVSRINLDEHDNHQHREEKTHLVLLFCIKMRKLIIQIAILIQLLFLKTLAILFAFRLLRFKQFRHISWMKNILFSEIKSR